LYLVTKKAPEVRYKRFNIDFDLSWIHSSSRRNINIKDKEDKATENKSKTNNNKSNQQVVLVPCTRWIDWLIDSSYQ